MNRFHRLLSASVLLALVACQDLPSDVQLETPSSLSRTSSTGFQAPPFVPGEVVVRVGENVDAATVAGDHGVSVASHGYQN
ncbi:MAG TPA: hypothetical protein VGB42_02775, partial [Candidatus Thermoplasmatota archaeon]